MTFKYRLRAERVEILFMLESVSLQLALRKFTKFSIFSPSVKNNMMHYCCTTYLMRMHWIDVIIPCHSCKNQS